jgi:hypothetical protein
MFTLQQRIIVKTPVNPSRISSTLVSYTVVDGLHVVSRNTEINTKIAALRSHHYRTIRLSEINASFTIR